ncbi:imidazoleglycerol-phosphate dehydratase [Methanospirillum hungatei JF-1]|jgi:imidazoleglycerol-phosphate dehydratase|uniref:Imidazoleglycerol-phosphate dehydratase n=1 Tax=Methanospirillum hungatei JF-1 (strain ATCC 27890 / DSM 864 / NBRC 100397 / JF-1) TaxID=323259 RepID=HIS7_METHJ|nr:imidazoleglycerol-phosphate dehydratase HisB [Methanospirillum hungatei]Q2FN13.1 RecName: Full=Imidazoleglycerol-phosphate dehydratase; Short=IGPD [Methanospirillum hungatei JF-1]ABD40670.1 imidazoleglycerol-phosphate dehydratase [Methanospirillum hungatei JF-1]OQA59913.1 MAG: imidazoleglycerol-phosphate dehydratase [Euryarchaeota archaeon ADurb.Bin294]
MRTAEIKRKTKETDITVRFSLDGSGKGTIHTGIPFFDHMLDSFTRHSRFDLDIQAIGDLEKGPHHTIEDIGIVLGQVFTHALGEGRGIQRFASVIVPMDESKAEVALDVGGRPYLVFEGSFSGPVEGVIESWLVRHFFESFIQNAKVTAHMNVSGFSDHHKCEALFKAFGVALHSATKIVYDDGQVPSTKGVL